MLVKALTVIAAAAACANHVEGTGSAAVGVANALLAAGGRGARAVTPFAGVCNRRAGVHGRAGGGGGGCGDRGSSKALCRRSAARAACQSAVWQKPGHHVESRGALRLQPGVFGCPAKPRKSTAAIGARAQPATHPGGAAGRWPGRPGPARGLQSRGRLSWPAATGGCPLQQGRVGGWRESMRSAGHRHDRLAGRRVGAQDHVAVLGGPARLSANSGACSKQPSCGQCASTAVQLWAAGRPRRRAATSHGAACAARAATPPPSSARQAATAAAAQPRLLQPRVCIAGSPGRGEGGGGPWQGVDANLVLGSAGAPTCRPAAEEAGCLAR